MSTEHRVHTLSPSPLIITPEMPLLLDGTYTPSVITTGTGTGYSATWTQEHTLNRNYSLLLATRPTGATAGDSVTVTFPLTHLPTKYIMIAVTYKAILPPPDPTLDIFLRYITWTVHAEFGLRIDYYENFIKLLNPEREYETAYTEEYPPPDPFGWTTAVITLNLANPAYTALCLLNLNYPKPNIAPYTTTVEDLPTADLEITLTTRENSQAKLAIQTIQVTAP